jgi:hypothetical protein
MTNTNTHIEASAVPVASKVPSLAHSSDTARVVSRKLRKAGFTMFKESTRSKQAIDGYWVRREGSGKRVAVSYLGYNAHLRYSERKEKENLAYEFLRTEGYLIDDNGYIQCEVSY